MDGTEFIQTARLLCLYVEREANLRSAISRAYYACFLATRKTVFENTPRESLAGASVGTERDIRHASLKRWLKNCSDQAVRALGVDLGDLEGERNKADYDMSRCYTHDQARETVDNARDYLAQLGSVEASLIGSQVGACLRQECQGNA
jgi:hypothetical protein